MVESVVWTQHWYWSGTISTIQALHARRSKLRNPQGAPKKLLFPLTLICNRFVLLSRNRVAVLRSIGQTRSRIKENPQVLNINSDSDNSRTLQTLESTMPRGTNSQGNTYNTPGGTNSNSGSSYHCKFALMA